MKPLVSGAAHRNGIMAVLLSALALTSMPATAQTPTNIQTRASLGTEYGTADGIDDLPGVDPSAALCTTGKPTNDNSLQFCFYNEGTGRFLSIGGLWGTHASISNTPYAIWLEKTGTDGQYWFNSKVDGSGTGSYMGDKNGNLWMDRSGSNGRVAFVFEQANGYDADKSKLYRIKIAGTSNYITTFPGNLDRLCNYATAYATSDAAYKNQVWKIISKAEYYTLAKANPATMQAVIDFSFLVQDADFRVNNLDAASWQVGTANGQPSTDESNLYLGDANMYCPFSKRGAATSGLSRFVNYTEEHQKNYGKYAYCYSRGRRDFCVYQEIKVHKAGWYVVRCNGFSTQQDMQGEDGPLAYLFMAQKATGADTYSEASTSTLNVVSAADAQALEQQSDKAGIGVAFFGGRYENQVQMCIETGDDGKTEPSESNPATLRLGYYVAQGKTAVGSDELTAVDNFKLLYAGPRRNPELILDENYTDLRYLTLANDRYTNSVLHLERTLNAYQWNSLILPCDLTLGQMKRTFGDAVKVAKLDRIEGGTVYFVTQEPASDNDVLVKAFEPYIVYPPVVNTTSQSYTANRFYTSADADDNSEWLSTDYTPTTDPDKALSKTVDANHYTITMVSLDGDKLKEHMEATKNGYGETWISNTSFSAAAAQGDMTCYGTLAKTYDENGIILGRDKLEQDYVMRNGKLVQVPTGYVYGLQAFRCWFEVKGKDDTATGAGANLSLDIDGVTDGTTSINDIHGDGALFTSRMRGIDGVYSLDGQLVRRGSSTQGLPGGIYICDGRKIVVY